MPANNWAHARISVSLHPSSRGPGTLCADWRLEAKAPGDEWTLRSTVRFGSERLQGMAWPPSRDDVLAVLVELLLGCRWEDDDQRS